MAWSRYARDCAARVAPLEKLIDRAGLVQRQAGEAQQLLADARAADARPCWKKLLGQTAVLSLALWVFVGAGEARAQGRLDTANDALPHCKNDAMTWSNGYCWGMIRGIVDVSNALSPEYRFCPPWEATREQVVRVVVADLERNPATLHLPFSTLAIGALRKAWPCR